MNLLDVAFQKHVCGGAGLRINRRYVMHANPGYVRSVDIVAAEFCHEQISDCISMQDLPTNATIREQRGENRSKHTQNAVMTTLGASQRPPRVKTAERGERRSELRRAIPK